MSPALARGAAELVLDLFEGVQQGSRLERCLHFEDLVQELRLVTNTDRLRLVHPRRSNHQDARLG